MSVAFAFAIRIFSAILLLNKKFSCETNVTNSIFCSSGISRRETPPIFTAPSVTFQNPAINLAIVDFPEPEGPTIAVSFFSSAVKFKSEKIGALS